MSSLVESLNINAERLSHIGIDCAHIIQAHIVFQLENVILENKLSINGFS